MISKKKAKGFDLTSHNVLTPPQGVGGFGIKFARHREKIHVVDEDVLGGSRGQQENIANICYKVQSM